MRPDASAGGNVPALDGAAILALAPDVADMAAIETVDWGMVPASHLDFGRILSIAAAIRSQLARPEIAGVIVVQGTDTIEETAFAYDLLLPTDKSVVVTGAMRDASSSEYDGPRNLLDAVRCAIAPELRGMGVNVVLGGLVVPADDVVKTSTTAMDTFQPRDRRPVARLVNDGVVIDEPRTRRRVLPRTPVEAVDDVFLVSVTTGMTGALIRALARLEPRGLVVAATGTGNTHPDVLAAATEVMDAGTIVVLTTRCPTGIVAPLYAFPGGGRTWERAGAVLSVFDGPKSRVALSLGIGARLNRDELAALIGE